MCQLLQHDNGFQSFRSIHGGLSLVVQIPAAVAYEESAVKTSQGAALFAGEGDGGEFGVTGQCLTSCQYVAPAVGYIQLIFFKNVGAISQYLGTNKIRKAVDFSVTGIVCQQVRNKCIQLLL